MDKKAINNQIISLETLEGLAHAYAQISSNRMKSIRSTVLSNRLFLQDLNEIFADVRNSYKDEVKKLIKKPRSGGKKGPITFLSHNGRTVSVLLSANAGLYGELTSKVFNLFFQEVEKEGSEATIIGRLGKSLFLQRAPNKPYTYFDFPDYGTDQSKLSEIIEHLVQYERIRVYHGKFQNIITQIPNVFNLEAETPIANMNPEGDVKNRTHYLFEPSLEKILIFFESQMFGSLLNQTINESQLAKFAARMFAMDTAGENIKGELKKMKINKLRLTHYIYNKKQVGSLPSFLKRI